MSRVELAENLRIKQAAKDLADDAKVHGVSILIVVRNHDEKSNTCILNGPFDELKYLLSMALLFVMKKLATDRRQDFADAFASDVALLPGRLYGSIPLEAPASIPKETQ